MQIEFVDHNTGRSLGSLDNNATWVCPRNGEVVHLKDKNWKVIELFHQIDRESLTIYMGPM